MQMAISGFSAGCGSDAGQHETCCKIKTVKRYVLYNNKEVAQCVFELCIKLSALSHVADTVSQLTLLKIKFLSFSKHSCAEMRSAFLFFSI